jgi:WD40 repeat protein
LDGIHAVSGGKDGLVKLWRLADGICLKTFKGKAGEVQSITVNYNCKIIIAQCKSETLVLDGDTGKALHMVHTGITTGFDVDFRFEQIYFACGADGVKKYDLKTRELVTYNQPANCLRLLPDNNIIATAHDESIWLSSMDQRGIRQAISTNTSVKSISVTPDGKYLAAMTARGVEIYRLDYYYKAMSFKDWDDGALPYQEIFLHLHPDYTEADFANLITELQNHGYGWLRPEGVRAKMDELQFGW